jgi:hypothetical protein
MNIRVHIERLIIEGLNMMPGQEAKVSAAVEGELKHLLAAGGLSPDLREGGLWQERRASPISARDDMNAAGLGTSIARSIYSGIGRRED